LHQGQTWTTETHVSAIVRDAAKFLKKFGHIIRRSALSTYISALPLTPRDTQLYESLHHTIPQSPSIRSSHPSWSSALLQIISGHTKPVHSVVFSPDGKKLASASGDETVRLWDVETGEAVGAPLEHTFRVGFVTFSPDGKKLASCDKAVRLWDVETGEAVGYPLKDITRSIEFVAFSSDGKKLVSVSSDGTERLWDVWTLTEEKGADVGAQVAYILSTQGISLSFDHAGFLCHSGKHLVWLPAINRGKKFAMYGTSTFAVGGSSGSVTIIRFST
jgi:WD40 repeat protein